MACASTLGVKIARVGQQRGPHQVPETFVSLPDDFASLGQETTYCEILARLPPDVRDAILLGLRDGADPRLAEQFVNEEVWCVSGLRFGSAAGALRSGPLASDLKRRCLSFYDTGQRFIWQVCASHYRRIWMRVHLTDSSRCQRASSGRDS